MSRKYIFGTNDKTAGQNLMEAITGDQSNGIPPYRFDKALAIMNKALNDDEVDILCRGYGINCERQSQIDIGTALKFKATEISKKAHHAVEKLQKSPYKMQLKALVPTLEELFALHDKNVALQNARTSSKEVGKLESRCQRTQLLLDQSEVARKAYEEENAHLSYELESMTKKLATAEAQLAESQSLNAKLTAQLTHMENIKNISCEVLKEVGRELSDVIDKTIDNAQMKFSTEVANSKINELDALGFSDGTINALSNIGVKDISALCKMTPHNLLRLGIGKKKLTEIEQTLSVKGLSLCRAN